MWEFVCNRKKFMMLIGFSRNQTLRWRLACRMFTKEYFWPQHLWKGGEGKRIGKRRIWAAMQAFPLPWLPHRHQSWSTLDEHGFLSPTSISFESGMIWEEHDLGWTNRSWGKSFFWGGIWMAYHHFHHSMWIILIYW